MLPWHSLKWVRSLGVLPAPDTPDFASMMIGDAMSRRRITAGARDERRAAERSAIPFRQAVHRRGGHLRRLGIPAATQFRVAQAERAREIEHAASARQERGRDLGRGGVGQREKDGIRTFRQHINVEPFDHVVPDARERGDASRGGAGAPHGGRQADGGMAGEQPQELHPCIPGRARDPDPDGLRITIHPDDYLYTCWLRASTT